MKAAYYQRTGPASKVLVIGDLADPVPAGNEVRVRVAFSGVNPSDVKGRGGISSSQMPFEFVVPHSDGSGVVDQVGMGVDPELVGKRVWFHNAQWQRQFGSAAEYVCLPVSQVVELGASTPLEVGAGFGIPLITAHHAVNSYGDIAGKTVLVTGGAGNVGFYSIQLARLAGAKVIATTSNADKSQYAALAGADLVLDYRNPGNLNAEVLKFTKDRGVDAIIEVNASINAPMHADLLAFGGKVIVYGSLDATIPVSYRGMMRRFASLHFFLVYLLSPAQLTRSIEAISVLLDDGLLQHPVSRIFGIKDIAAAHEFVEAGSMGKALLKIS